MITKINFSQSEEIMAAGTNQNSGMWRRKGSDHWLVAFPRCRHHWEPRFRVKTSGVGNRADLSRQVEMGLGGRLATSSRDPRPPSRRKSNDVMTRWPPRQVRKPTIDVTELGAHSDQTVDV
ncbi:hypothetical protein C0Q70_13728 [Pomacea canaliculata]|uniref:Uncharacterized protein n=1 Tax=Pomacea canaliculata TaxID=400727 RepID=A0A2T7NY05_POMCA|nr:hypothetical protein C0Q70_13728 [Pomacea canaliculata]